MQEGQARRTSYFVLYLILFALAGAWGVFFVPKGDIEVFINQHHQPLLDTFFKYWTHAGDGLMFAVLGVALLFVRYRYVIIMLLSILMQSIFVQGSKHLFFKGMLRPKAFLAEMGITDLNFVEGVTVNSFNTFPSGHTAAAFSMACLLAFVLRDRPYTSMLLFIAALMVGFSRVYLMQHFYVDIYAGAVIGSASTVIVWYFFQRRFGEKYEGHWLSKSLLRRS